MTVMLFPVAGRSIDYAWSRFSGMGYGTFNPIQYSFIAAVARCPSVCLSVRPSVTLVYSVETSKHIFEFLSASLYFSKRGAY